jgi:hypothetical protein
MISSSYGTLFAPAQDNGIDFAFFLLFLPTFFLAWFPSDFTYPSVTGSALKVIRVTRKETYKKGKWMRKEK